MNETNHKISSSSVSIDTLSSSIEKMVTTTTEKTIASSTEKLFTSPLKDVSGDGSFNYDYIGEINVSGGITQEFAMNSDLSIYQLLENLSNYTKQILEYLNIPPKEEY